MDRFYVEPEVAGSLGPATDLDTSTHPPVVRRLEYRMEGWLGDCLLESFPVFVVTEEARRAIEAAGLSGAAFDAVTITVSPDFMSAKAKDGALPAFAWLKPAKDGDVATAPDGRLLLSQRALDVLKPLGLANAEIEPA
jgi:hypothetical protein